MFETETENTIASSIVLALNVPFFAAFKIVIQCNAIYGVRINQELDQLAGKMRAIGGTEGSIDKMKCVEFMLNEPNA